MPGPGSVADRIRDAVNGLLRGSGLPELKGVAVDTTTCKLEDVLDECGDDFKKAVGVIEDILGLRAKIRELRESGKAEEARKLEGELRRLEGSLEGFTRCMKGFIVLGTYDCNNAVITIYLKCFELAECKTRGFLTRELAETLAHELIHHLQFTSPGAALNVGGERVRAVVDMRGRCGSDYRDIYYPYRPHEAEAFDKQGRLASALLGVEEVRRALGDLAGEALRLLGV